MRQRRSLLAMAALMLSLTGCGQSKSEKNEDYYGEIIAGLGDEEQAQEDIGEKTGEFTPSTTRR